MCVCVYLTCSICLSQINPDKVFSNRRNPQDLPIMWVKFSNTALKHQNCVNLYLLYHRTELMIDFKNNIMNSRTGSSLKLLVLVFSGFYLPWPPHPPPPSHLPRPCCHNHCISSSPFRAPSSAASQRSLNKREERASATWTGLHPNKILQSSWPAAP